MIGPVTVGMLTRQLLQHGTDYTAVNTDLHPRLTRMRRSVTVRVQTWPDLNERHGGADSRVGHIERDRQLNVPSARRSPPPNARSQLLIPASRVLTNANWRSKFTAKELGIAGEHYVQMTIALCQISVSCLSRSA